MKNIRCGWILLGGVLTELATFAIVLPLSFSALYSAPPASFVTAFAFGYWVAKKSPQNRVLSGALVGVVAHVLKVLGGAAGGFVALRRANANAVLN